MPLRGVIAAVVVMGVLILGGLAVLIATIAGRISHAPAVPVTASALPAAGLTLPDGARVEALGVGGDKIVLDLVLPGGDRELLVIDLATGRQVGMVPLHTAR